MKDFCNKIIIVVKLMNSNICDILLEARADIYVNYYFPCFS